MIIAKFIAAILIGYLLGSIPFGLIISKRSAKVDVREHGSGKTGATNVLRTAGKKAALAVALLDISKGALAATIGGLLIGRSYLVIHNIGVGMIMVQVLAALAAVVGHIWPVFLKFRGGRGVSTFFGGLAVLCPVAALFGGEILIIGTGLTKFVSLGSIAGAVGTYAILIPLTIFNNFPIEYLLYSLIGTILLVYMHRDNISRLMAGTERRIGEKTEVYSASSGKRTSRTVA